MPVTTAAHRQQPCPACGFAVFAHFPGGRETCPVCGWIDDLEQLVHVDVIYGANNGRSLRQAQCSALDGHPLTQQRVGEFARDARWRPLAPGETPVAGADSLASPVCYLGTPEAEEYEPYWLAPAR